MKKIKNILGATISNIIVAFIFIVIICVAIRLSIGDQLMQAIALINLVSVSDKNNNTESEAIKIDLENKNLTHYPAWGKKYGTLSIDSINVKLGLYYGDSLSILRKGVGQSVSYFPGEGGSIICMAHDTGGFLKYLYTVNVGDKIKIKTDYGNFTYEIYETKIVDQSDTSAVYLQEDEEILMLYTCYPSNSIGHATHRFVTYSKLIEGDIF